MTSGQIILALTIYIVASMFAGKIAHDKGRSAPGLILLSLILSPLFGIAVALILQPGQSHQR
jgi:cation transporter-like permease